MKKIFITFFALSISWKKPAVAPDIKPDAFSEMNLQQYGLSHDAFLLGIKGYSKLEGQLSKPILTIIDFSQPSSKKRLYIIDMNKKKLITNTLVAHGKNSGDSMATRFSNIKSSLKSSLGFFITGETYNGNNGLSMRLHGKEEEFNNNAYLRAIVMHGSSYVNERGGMIGRSWGCPAVSNKEHKEIISLLKDGSCLFIYAPDSNYLAKSNMIK